MIKITDGDKTISAGPYLNEEEILAAITYLREQITEIDHYLDRSLFFQNPLIIEGWLHLVRVISNIEKWEAPEADEQWEERTETYVAYLITMKEIRVQYQNICHAYYDKLKELMNNYGGWLIGDCVSAEGIEALCADQYEKDLNDVDDIDQFLRELNEYSLDARSSVYITLSNVCNILVTIMNRGAKIVFDLNPSMEDFAKAIDADLREWTLSFKEDMLEKMEEEMSRYYMEDRTNDITPGHWSKMLDADEEAFRLAIRQELAKCDDIKQEHWGEDRKVEMDENGKLMQQIYSSSKNKELLDLSKAEKVKPFIDLLQPDNLSLSYDIVVRRSIIQCEMFPELKTQQKEWLKENKDNQQGDGEIQGLSAARRSKLNEIIGVLRKGNWKLPATSENIEMLMNTVYGKDLSSLEEVDIPLCEKMWSLVEGGRGDRIKIISANLAGFFADENLLIGTSTEISNELFGNDKLVNNVTDGKKNHRSNAFEAVIPFLSKYMNKIILQE